MTTFITILVILLLTAIVVGEAIRLFERHRVPQTPLAKGDTVKHRLKPVSGKITCIHGHIATVEDAYGAEHHEDINYLEVSDD